MEGFFAALQYLETHPAVAALIEVATLVVVLVAGPLVLRAIGRVAREAKDGRRKIHERIDAVATEFAEHEKRDERFHGEISASLKFLVGKNGGNPSIIGEKHG